MLKKALAIFYFFTILAIGGCTSTVKPTLHGYYQSKDVSGYIIGISFQQDDNTFVKYIDNREVDKGTYEMLDDNQYLLKGEIKEDKIKLEEDNSFEISINKINNSKPIKIEFVNKTPQYFKQQFDDIEEYKSLYN